MISIWLLVIFPCTKCLKIEKKNILEVLGIEWAWFWYFGVAYGQILEGFEFILWIFKDSTQPFKGAENCDRLSLSMAMPMLLFCCQCCLLVYKGMDNASFVFLFLYTYIWTLCLNKSFPRVFILTYKLSFSEKKIKYNHYPF